MIIIKREDKIRKKLLLKSVLLSILVFLLLFPVSLTFGHCPLCTAGAGIGAIIAKELGMKSSAIVVWIGAFSVAMGWWIYNVLLSRLKAPTLNLLQRQVSVSGLGRQTLTSAKADRQRPRFAGLRHVLFGVVQKFINILRINSLANLFLILISFLSIVLPLKLYFYEVGSFYLYLFGDYGTLFNRTYVYDKFLVGSILGGLIILISPLLSKKLSKIRQGKTFPYQGLVITFSLLIIFSFLLQVKF